MSTGVEGGNGISAFIIYFSVNSCNLWDVYRWQYSVSRSVSHFGPDGNMSTSADKSLINFAQNVCSVVPLLCSSLYSHKVAVKYQDGILSDSNPVFCK